MKAILFDDFEVEIHPKSVEVGGSWTSTKNGPVAWDSELVKFFYDKLKELNSPVFFDIGASTGSFCLLTKFLPGSFCVAIEPNIDISELLQKNVFMNSLNGQIHVRRYALYESDMTVSLKVPESNSDTGLANIGIPNRFRKWSERNIQAYALDNIPFTFKVDVIKIDTEGCELPILKGGEKFLREHRPKLLLENNSKNMKQFGYEPKEMIKFLETLGYSHFEDVGKEDLWAE